jgi:DNA repair protein RecN (Recombination protein N)
VLEEISIENLGVISRAHVDLAGGLTAITGETGAGKTMVLTGLSLLLGAKADPATVRAGAKSATVEGRISAINSTVLEMVDDAGGVLDDDGALIVSRSVASAGRSRTFLGGRSVPQQVLSDVAREIVTIHGQSEQIRLKTASKQRAALDEFAGVEHEDLVATYRSVWAERADVEARLDRLVSQRRERSREAELLRLGLAEVERVEPQPHEDAELAAEALRLSNVEELRAGAQEAHTRLSGGEFGDGEVPASIIESLDAAARAISGISQHDSSLDSVATKMREAQYALEDIATELASYIDGLDADPARLEVVEARRAELFNLTRSYGDTIEAVLAWASEAGLRLMDLEDDSATVELLSDELDRLGERLTQVAAQITASRQRAARNLGEAVSAELAGLAMKGASIEVVLEPLEELGPWGAESVSMLLTAHPGAPARPLGKGASGGELSRVMLALEVALATASQSGARSIPTMIFDEVDSGVGGQAAIEIGKRLALLARTFQVIVVTHLPQVAAHASTHLQIVKTSQDGETSSTVETLDRPGRIRELARMLAGDDASDVALAHAEELLDEAGRTLR